MYTQFFICWEHRATQWRAGEDPEDAPACPYGDQGHRMKEEVCVISPRASGLGLLMVSVILVVAAFFLGVWLT